jgi:hypothetical protein
MGRVQLAFDSAALGHQRRVALVVCGPQGLACCTDGGVGVDESGKEIR